MSIGTTYRRSGLENHQHGSIDVKDGTGEVQESEAFDTNATKPCERETFTLFYLLLLLWAVKMLGGYVWFLCWPSEVT